MCNGVRARRRRKRPIIPPDTNAGFAQGGRSSLGELSIAVDEAEENVRHGAQFTRGARRGGRVSAEVSPR